MQSWKTKQRETILDCGKFLRVENHVVELPDGRLISDWPWVITPDFINVVALTTAGAFLCFRQTKYALAGVSLGLVGGYIEPGEKPLAAAKRELREETGYEAARWISLGQFPVDANRGAGHAHLFLALEAQQVTAPDSDDLEEQELLLLSRAEVQTGLAAGDFKILPWAAAVGLALLHLDHAS